MAHKPSANFINGFLLDVRNSFLNIITGFYYYIENTEVEDLQKFIHADTALW